jgi:hypothetical protein
MRNNLLRYKSCLVLKSIMVVLLFTLFTTVSFPTFAHEQIRQDSHSHTVSSLQNAPSGRANLTWNPQSKALTATLSLHGLQPGSNHAAHIHAGTCSSMGKILYGFKNVVADAAGNGTSMTTINNVTGGIPAKGWQITVHRGSTAQTGDLLCGNVSNPMRVTSVSFPFSPVSVMH